MTHEDYNEKIKDSVPTDKSVRDVIFNERQEKMFRRLVNANEEAGGMRYIIDYVIDFFLANTRHEDFNNTRSELEKIANEIYKDIDSPVG